MLLNRIGHLPRYGAHAPLLRIRIRIRLHLPAGNALILREVRTWDVRRDLRARIGAAKWSRWHTLVGCAADVCAWAHERRRHTKPADCVDIRPHVHPHVLGWPAASAHAMLLLRSLL